MSAGHNACKAAPNYESLKENWDLLCSQVADMCSYAGAPEGAAPDSWTLRDALIRLRTERDEARAEVLRLVAGGVALPTEGAQPCTACEVDDATSGQSAAYGHKHTCERQRSDNASHAHEEWCVICKREPRDHTDEEYRACMAACGMYDGGEHPSIEAVAAHRAALAEVARINADTSLPYTASVPAGPPVALHVSDDADDAARQAIIHEVATLLGCAENRDVVRVVKARLVPVADTTSAAWVMPERRGGENRLTRAAYEKLVAEDLEWLAKQPRTLERDHIRVIIEASVDGLYPAAAPSSCAAQPDEVRAREWLQANVLVPERYRDEWVATLAALLADVRHETTKACAKVCGNIHDAWMKNAKKAPCVGDKDVAAGADECRRTLEVLAEQKGGHGGA